MKIGSFAPPNTRHHHSRSFSHTFRTRFSERQNCIQAFPHQRPTPKKHENRKMSAVHVSTFFLSLVSLPRAVETYSECTCIGRVLHENVTCLRVRRPCASGGSNWVTCFVSLNVNSASPLLGRSSSLLNFVNVRIRRVPVS